MADALDQMPETAAVIQQGIRENVHLGAQVFVSLRGDVVSDAAIGNSIAEVPLRPDTVMLWLSSVKPVTAVALAQLVEAGQVQWHDPVNKFIPEFGTNGKESITIWHLLTHTGGFRSADRIPEECDWEDTIARICRAPLEPEWIPGRRAGYHLASSWFVLGEIVRRLSGGAFDRYVREYIFEPLGMFDSWIGMPPDRFRFHGDRIGAMHVKDGAALKPHPLWNSELGCALVRPGSNGRGPIRELGRFYEFLLAAWLDNFEWVRPSVRPILKSDTVRTMATRQRIDMFDHTFLHKMDWGLGFIINSNRYGIETIPYGYGRHASEETFGHSGSQSSCAFADPANALVVAWVFNGLPGERVHQRRARALNAAIYQDLGLGK